jgi:hypothetical protein
VSSERRESEPIEDLESPIPSSSFYDANGVDRSVVRWMLGLTPTERLDYAQGLIDLIKGVRAADGRL